MVRKTQHIDFKDGVNHFDLLYIHPTLLKMVAFISDFAHMHKLPFKITSMIRTEAEERRVGASSRTHRDSRAFDFSTRGWDVTYQLELEVLMKHEFRHEGAISSKSGLVVPVKFHNNGHGDHGHVQCRS